MHSNNIFLTLTYDDEHLLSPKLQYLDFQLFMKTLRERRLRGLTDPDLKAKLFIPTVVTGEYGDEFKRPHWHALLFNYAPEDSKYKYTTDRGDKVHTSLYLSSLWQKGALEFGDVTLDSANYVARYAAKKLIHGKDQDHDYHPIHKTSSKYAIGKSWLEKNWEFTFNNGYVVLPNGSQAAIPRYYEDWLKKTHPEEWIRYVTKIKPEIQKIAEKNKRKEEIEYFNSLCNQKYGDPLPIKKREVKLTILNSKFKTLQEKLKL